MAGGDGKANNSAKANDANNAAPQFQFAQKPEEKPGWEGFKQFLWNSETSEFLGRTASSWAKIGIFYIIYYGCLTGYFIAMLVIFYQTLDDHEPKWKGANGIIGDNPGLGYRPHPDPDDHVESTLIWYRHGTHGNYEPWVQRLTEHLKGYEHLKKQTTKGSNKPNPDIIECSYKTGPSESPQPPQICKVDADKLLTGPCTKEQNFGFKNGTPCILLKLNKIYDWVPEPYNSSADLPDHAPKILVDYVKGLEAKGEPGVGKMVWMNCEGENPADRENIGKIDYYPSAGIPAYHFPYQNQNGYLSPAVFAHLTKPKRGVLIAISCKAWAKNIKHDSMERMGSVHFELMID